MKINLKMWILIFVFLTLQIKPFPRLVQGFDALVQKQTTYLSAGLLSRNRNRIHLKTLEPEPYSEYGSGSGSEYKKIKQTAPKIN